MSKYRKRPVVIDAFQMTRRAGLLESEWPEWLRRAWEADSRVEGALWLDEAPEGTFMYCGTLEGAHMVTWDDFIIRGIQGEIYPCKPDIFEATYEAVKEGQHV